MEAGESGRRRLERLRAREAECAAALTRVRRDIVAIEAGIAGEEKIATVLARLTQPEWWVLHDRRKGPRSPANIDHIVIGPTGVHVIDAKNWSGKLWIGDKGIICGRIPRADDERALIELRDLVARELSRLGFSVPVYGVVALANDETATETIVHGGIAYVPPTHLLDGIKGRDAVVNPEQAYRLWEMLDDLHPPRAASVSTSSSVRRRRPVRRQPTVVTSMPVPPQRSVRRTRRWPRFALATIAAIMALGVIEAGAHHLSSSLDNLTNVSSPTPTPSPAVAGVARSSKASVNQHQHRRRHRHHKQPS